MILNITSIGLLLGLPRKLIYSFSGTPKRKYKYFLSWGDSQENEFIHFLELRKENINIFFPGRLYGGVKI